MAFPTATVTQGSGLTINTLPNAGQATMANSLGVAIASDQSAFPVTSLSSGAITNPTSTLTRPSNTTAYASGQLIASSTTAGSVVVPSFSIASAAGGAILPRIRIRASLSPSSWQGVNLSVNLWSAAPTYTNGDAQPYAVATGSATWLANYLVTLTQFGDGSVGAGPLTGANEMALKLASGTVVYWDLQVLNSATPAAGQTFTLIPELLN
jgi:hypothetical protein